MGLLANRASPSLKDKEDFKDIVDVLLETHMVSDASKACLRLMQAQLGRKKMTPDGCARKKNITEKLFHLKLTTDMILDLYLAVLPLLKQYVVFFERAEPSIHLLLDEQERLLRNFFACFIAPEALQDISVHRLLRLKLERYFLPRSVMFLGAATEQHLSSNSSSALMVETFLEQAKEGYLACGKYLQKKMPLENKFLQAAQALDPMCRGHTSTRVQLKTL